jgi:hypothetical protein
MDCKRRKKEKGKRKKGKNFPSKNYYCFAIAAVDKVVLQSIMVIGCRG